jgi:hypothetical protein
MHRPKVFRSGVLMILLPSLGFPAVAMREKMNEDKRTDNVHTYKRLTGQTLRYARAFSEIKCIRVDAEAQ